MKYAALAFTIALSLPTVQGANFPDINVKGTINTSLETVTNAISIGDVNPYYSHVQVNVDRELWTGTSDQSDPLTGLYVFLNLDPSTTNNIGVNGMQVGVYSDFANSNHWSTLSGTINVVGHEGQGIVDNLTAATMEAYVDYGGLVNNQYGAFVASANFGTGTITNSYGVHVASQGNGRIVNRYGLYVGDQSAKGTNAWNLYSSGATARNHFDGPIDTGSSITSGAPSGGTAAA